MPPVCFFALSDTDQPMLVWWIILALIAVGPALHSWVKVVEHFKGKRFDLSNYVTQAQLASVKRDRDAELAATVGAIKSDLSRLEAMLSTIAQDLPAIHRALGRLEGHDDSLSPRKRRAQ